MSKRSASTSYEALGKSCRSGMGARYNKERFSSEQQARKRAKNNRKWRKGHALPVPYQCPDCHGWHLTSPSDW